LADEIGNVQQVLTNDNKQLRMPDRAAHQQQLAASVVTLTVAKELPGELKGLGVFDSGGGTQYTGIGRVSTGLGCPHVETHPDFLGIMVAFRTQEGRRVDFLGINDPAAPTDTVAEFIALLNATADAAGTDNVLWQQAEVGAHLFKSLHLKGAEIALHVVRQTHRTQNSSSAIQQYWTGIVGARDILGKFTLVPLADPNQSRDRTQDTKLFSNDWKRRQTDADVEFKLYWIPYLNDTDTPLTTLTDPWSETHKIGVGAITFPKTEFESRSAKLVELLASEMGANPGNWVSRPTTETEPELPATEFTAGRFFAYRKSQQGRNALPEEKYASFFDKGEISEELATELISRYENKRRAGHAVPDLGDLQ
jgi:hypothetical protein